MSLGNPKFRLFRPFRLRPAKSAPGGWFSEFPYAIWRDGSRVAKIASMYETFEHTADLGLRVTAADLPALFCEAARGLFSIIVADPSSVIAREQLQIEVTGQRHDELLFDWLSELLYLFESKRMLLAEFEVEIDDRGLRATVAGEPWDPDRHLLEHEVKAITYHGLKVEETSDGWLAEVIVDI